MAHVARDHLLDQLLADLRVIRRLLPAGQFVQHVQAQLVAGVEKVFIRRIMRHPHGVHVHFLDQPDISVADFLTQASARIRPETVSTDTFESDLLPIKIQPVACTHLERPEAKMLRDLVDRAAPLTEHHPDGREIRRLRRPGLVSPDLCLQSHHVLGGPQFRSERRC